MGLFSSIGKAFRNIGRGIRKAFRSVMTAVSKVLDSKLGKALMMAVSIFTMGTALLAGAQGFAGATGFVNKFVTGGQEFINSLLGTSFGQEGGGKVANVAGGGSAVTEGAATPNAAMTQPGGMADEMLASAGAPAGVEKMTDIAAKGNFGAATQDTGNWLSKAAAAAKSFAKSDAGQTIIGGIIQGAGAGMRDAEWMKHDRRIERQFNDPNNPGMLSLAAHDYSVDTPRGLAAAPGQLAQRESQASGRYTPTIPYRN